MNRSYLSLGSNMGDRMLHLQEAVSLLADHPSIEVVRLSSIYETEPVGYEEQAPFLNMVVHLETVLAPQALLEACQEIEQALHRKRLIRWGPRTIDLDILLYNHDNMETEDLTVPHPRMRERAFVLVPLLELEPGILDPASGRPFAAVPDKGVRLFKASSDVLSFIQSGGEER